MTTRPRHMGQSDDDWAMPFGDSIYTHAPDTPSLHVGSAYQRTTEKVKGRKVRRIGFKPPYQRAKERRD